MNQIFSHLIAAVILPLIAVIFLIVKRRKRFVKNKKEFWARQNTLFLEENGFLQKNNIPSPLNFLGEFETWRTIIETVSLCNEAGLLDFLNDETGGATFEHIKNFLGFNTRAANAVIDLLLAVDVLNQFDDKFVLTENAKLYLLKKSPLYQPLPPAKFAKRFLKIAKSGKPAGAVKKWGSGKAVKPENWAIRQHQNSFPLGFALANSGLLKGKNILDVAGGTGAVLIALGLKNPRFKMKLIELPGSVNIAEKMIAKYGLSKQIECIGMNMFEGYWSSNMDTVLFTNIFHDWDDEKCLILARKAYASLNSGGVISIQEALINEGKPGPLWTVHWMVMMAIFMQGRQFRKHELEKILTDAGFVNIRTVPLLGYYSSVTGQKP